MYFKISVTSEVMSQSPPVSSPQQKSFSYGPGVKSQKNDVSCQQIWKEDSHLTDTHTYPVPQN